MSKVVRRDTVQAGVSAARIRKIEYRSNVRVRGDRAQFRQVRQIRRLFVRFQRFFG